MGVLKPDEEHILINGKAIGGLPLDERNIGYMPQDFWLFPHLNTYESVAFGLRVRKHPKARIRERVSELICTVNL